jgi:hypothetical protein
MAKKPKEQGKLPLKEENLNLVISAQKEKIEALTAYGKKLKQELKDCKQSVDDNCQELIDAFHKDLKAGERLHTKVLVLSVIASLLFGLFIGMVI